MTFMIMLRKFKWNNNVSQYCVICEKCSFAVIGFVQKLPMDLDLDLDLENDRIQEFLEAKLKVIQAANQGLEESLKLRQTEQEKLRKAIREKSSKILVKVRNCWKKIVNDKYIFGLTLSPPIHISSKSFNVLLHWNSPESLSYEFTLVPKNLKNMDGLKWKCEGENVDQILIVMHIPCFISQLDYTIDGALYFGQNQCVPLPQIQISTKDPFSEELRLNLADFPSEIDVITYAFANDKHELVLIGTEPWKKSLEAMFLDCQFKLLPKILSGRQYYAISNLSPAIDGCLLEVEKIESKVSYYINVFCRNKQSLINLLHFVYRNIKPCVILPRELYHTPLNSENAKELLKKALREEVDIAAKCLNDPDSKPDVSLCKHKLVEKENATDILVARIKALQTSD